LPWRKTAIEFGVTTTSYLAPERGWRWQSRVAGFPAFSSLTRSRFITGVQGGGSEPRRFSTLATRACGARIDGGVAVSTPRLSGIRAAKRKEQNVDE
jgi:hypothetical protein